MLPRSSCDDAATQGAAHVTNTRSVSKLQASLARAVGERLYPAVVQVPAAVEHAALETRLLRVGGEQLAHLGRLLGLVALEGLLQVEPAGRGERAPLRVVDELRGDAAVGAKDREARAL